ncbi:MAG: NHL repeat-containing protein [Planctomycetota bacterium]|nr:NHL repeat-containing protein [Planctomycetota bacterium]
MTILLLLMLCSGPDFYSVLPSGTQNSTPVSDEVLSLGHSLGTISFAPAVPVAICSLERGGFAVLTERPAHLLIIDASGERDGEPVALPGVISRPRGILQLSRGHFIVVDRSGVLGEIDRKGRWVRTLPGPATPWQAGAMASGPGGKGWLVSDLLRGQIHHLDVDGQVQNSWSGFIEPTGICAIGEKIWVSDRGHHRLFRFDPRSEQPDASTAIGDHGAAPGLLAAPMGLCSVADRFLLVTDQDNHRVQVFGRHGISMHNFGIHSMLPRIALGRLHYPTAVAFDRTTGVCAVIEPSERRMQRFGVRDPESPVPAAEQWQRVDLVSHFGAFWALQPGGRLLAVSEPDSERISILVRDLENPFEVDDIGGHGSLPTRFRAPTGIDFLRGSASPRIVVADRGNRRLQMFEVPWEMTEPLSREPALIRLVRSVDVEQLATLHPSWNAPVPPRLTALACNESGTIAVCDDANSRILLLDERFRATGVFEAPGLLREATAISADGDGFLVADAGSGQLMRFVPGQLVPELIETGSTLPVGVDRHPDGSIWFTDGANHSLLRIPPEGGDAEVILGGAGTGERQLFRPRAVRIDEDGSVWILDHGNHRGVVISPEGQLRHFGSKPYLPAAATGSSKGRVQ